MSTQMRMINLWRSSSTNGQQVTLMNKANKQAGAIACFSKLRLYRSTVPVSSITASMREKLRVKKVLT